MWRSRISILVILATYSNYAFSWATAKDFLPTRLEIGFDIARPPYYLWREKTGAQYEFNTQIDFNRTLLAVDYGWGSILRKNPAKKPVKTISDNWGQYFRVGLSYNFIPNNKDRNAAFLGLMYSRSSFREAIYGNLLDNKIYNANDTVAVDTSDKLHAQWLEIVAGVQVPIWQWVYIGCTVRYKFAKQVSLSETLIPFDIIGWGLHEEDDAWGVNYYIGIRVPLGPAAGQASNSLGKKQPTLTSPIS